MLKWYQSLTFLVLQLPYLSLFSLPNLLRFKLPYILVSAFHYSWFLLFPVIVLCLVFLLQLLYVSLFNPCLFCCKLLHLILIFMDELVQPSSTKRFLCKLLHCYSPILHFTALFSCLNCNDQIIASIIWLLCYYLLLLCKLLLYFVSILLAHVEFTESVLLLYHLCTLSVYRLSFAALYTCNVSSWWWSSLTNSLLSSLWCWNSLLVPSL